MENSFGQGELI